MRINTQSNTKSTVTLLDVARRAGVGKTAASVALFGSKTNSRVSEATRQCVLAAAADLHYVPNAMARGLNSVRLQSLGVTFPILKPNQISTNFYGASVLSGILGAAHAAGYNVTHFHRPWHDAKQSAPSFRAQGIDGFLIVAPLAGSDMVSGLSELGIPLVVISTSSEVHNVPAVDIDNHKIVRLALDHLLSLGHRRIAHMYLSGNHDSFDNTARRESFLQIMAAAGMPVPPEYLSPIPEDYKPTAYDQTRALLSLPNPPTALFATNDFLARDAIETAHVIGVRVPEQFSVVGVDDYPIASIPPGITSIRQPLVEMAEEATRTLIALIEGEDVPAETHWFEPELIVRGSTARPDR